MTAASDTAASLRRVSTAGTSASRRYTNPEVGYPHGHIGHLTPEETQLLLDFRALVEEKGYYKPGPPPSHQDHTLLYVSAGPCSALWRSRWGKS